MQSQIRFNRICSHLAHGNPAEVIPALGLAARFRQICKNKTLRLLGIPPKVIFFRERCVFNILTSKCASHRSGVQLSISHAARKLRAHCFSEPIFRPPGGPQHQNRKNSVPRFLILLARFDLLSTNFFSDFPQATKNQATAWPERKQAGTRNNRKEHVMMMMMMVLMMVMMKDK